MGNGCAADVSLVFVTYTPDDEGDEYKRPELNVTVDVLGQWSREFFYDIPAK